MATISNEVGEMQGLYGPFTIAERVLQKIWLRRDFAEADARLTDGRKLVIRSPGTWNLLGGPDFRNAVILLDGVPTNGDVEVHFHASDWHAHRHVEDHAYDKVALHVVLFPPGLHERVAQRRDGELIPTLVLLPLLVRGLEEYAADDAIERLTDQDTIEKIADLARRPVAERTQILSSGAMKRWTSKVRFARLRIEKLGWSEALHHTALEILGYRRNRSAMLATATHHPFAEWRIGISPDSVYLERRESWQVQGIRPANHPLGRLRQYQRWVATCPKWPESLEQIGRNLRKTTHATESVAEYRKGSDPSRCREEIAHAVVGDSVGGSRLDTMICDGFLPMLAVRTGEEGSFYEAWFNWFLGDVPADFRKALKVLEIAGTRSSPFCHGWAQGFLQWMLDVMPAQVADPLPCRGLTSV